MAKDTAKDQTGNERSASEIVSPGIRRQLDQLALVYEALAAADGRPSAAFLLVGPKGAGKTSTAVQAWADRGEEVIVINAGADVPSLGDLLLGDPAGYRGFSDRPFTANLGAQHFLDPQLSLAEATERALADLRQAAASEARRPKDKSTARNRQGPGHQ